MEFRVLGPLEVRADDGPVRVDGAKERALLARLLLDVGRPVPVGTLLEDVWHDDGRSAARSLQVRVSTLRGLLGADAVVREVGSYCLDVDPQQVDLTRFTDLVAEAEGQTPADRLDLLDRALALWRARPMPELDDAIAVRPAIARLETLHRSAREQRAAALHDLGRIDEAVAELERLIGEDPLAERPVMLVMRALVAAGRQSEALAAYRALADRLDEEGLVPDPALRDLEREVLLQQAGGLREPDPADLADVPDLADTPPPLPTLYGPLIGRDGLVSHLEAVLVDAPLMTLWGPGGVGKTRLALELAHRAMVTRRCGARLVDLTLLEDPQGLGSAIAVALGLPGGGSDPLPLVQRWVHDHDALLVLDNAEHLMPEVAQALAAVTSRGRGRVLVTSRVALGLRSEHVVAVDPLATGADQAGGQSPAAAFYRERAIAAGGAVDDEDAIAELCTMLDGVPLALELAAARSRLLPAAALVRRLRDDDGQDVLDVAGGDRPARHRSLLATLDWSLQLLDIGSRTLYAVLGAFAGPARLEALEAVAEDPRTLEDLAALVDAALVRAVPTGGSGEVGYTQLTPIRTHAARMLDRRPDVQRVRDRHAAHHLAIAQAAAPAMRTAAQRQVIADLEPARADLLRAIDHLLGTGEVDAARQLAVALERFWWLSGRLNTAVRQYDRVDATPGGDPGLRAQVAAALAVARTNAGQVEAAVEAADRALALAAAADPAAPAAPADPAEPAAPADLSARLAALGASGYARVHRGDVDHAVDQLQQAVDLAAQLGLPALELEMRLRHATTVAFAGDLEASEALTRRALEAWPPDVDPWGRAQAQNNLAMMRLYLGDVEGASMVQQLVEELGEAEVMRTLPWIIDSAAMVARASGDLDRAERYFEAVRRRQDAAGDEVGRVLAITGLAGVCIDRGQHAAAAGLLAEVVGLPALDAHREALLVVAVDVATMALGVGLAALAVGVLDAADAAVAAGELPAWASPAAQRQRLRDQAAAQLDGGEDPLPGVVDGGASKGEAPDGKAADGAAADGAAPDSKAADAEGSGSTVVAAVQRVLDALASRG